MEQEDAHHTLAKASWETRSTCSVRPLNMRPLMAALAFSAAAALENSTYACKWHRIRQKELGERSIPRFGCGSAAVRAWPTCKTGWCEL